MKNGKVSVIINIYCNIILYLSENIKKLLIQKQVVDDIKQVSYDICKRHKVNIKYMEADKDHIHYMIETMPNINLSNLVKTIKSYTTYHIWRTIQKDIFGKKKHFGQMVILYAQ